MGRWRAEGVTEGYRNGRPNPSVSGLTPLTPPHLWQSPKMERI